MNKLFLFLAFAVFALIACSEDKPAPTHSELCAKKPITKECLIGKWILENVIRESDNPEPLCDSKGELKLEANGDFSFKGGIYNLTPYGIWNLNEKGEIEIEFIAGTNLEIPDKITATTEVRYTTGQLRLTSYGYTSFSQCKINGNTKLIEVFTWSGSN